MKSATHHANVRDDYFALVKEFPLMPIRSAGRLKVAQRVIDGLAVKGTTCRGLTTGEQAYLEVLIDLAERYEARQAEQNLASGRDGVERLRFLMEEHGLNASDLGRLLGSRDLGSKILRRERELSKAHLLILAGRFGVDPGLFFS